jgi:hypothetical protein
VLPDPAADKDDANADPVKLGYPSAGIAFAQNYEKLSQCA